MSDKPLTPILISSTDKVEGWQEVKCYTCDELVYDHKENIELVRRMNGFVICVPCALKAKVMGLGGSSLNVEAQLWHGHLREPQLANGWKPVIDFLNRKE